MKKIGCAGILVADTFCGPMAALPRPGSLLAVDSLPSMAGGCAANVAVDLVRQGLEADIAGCVGEDAAAEMVRRYLAEHGVGLSGLRTTPEWPTSQTVILLVEGEDRRYIHLFGANSAFSSLSEEWLSGLDVLYVGGMYALPGFSPKQLGEALRFCRRRGIISVVDVVISSGNRPDAGLSEWLPYADWFLPNNDEAELLTGVSETGAQLEAMAALGARGVVVTRGADGLAVLAEGRTWEATAHRLGPCVDPSGAGDAFTAGWIAGLARNLDIPDRIAYGAALGYSATQAVGTTAGVFTAAEAEAFMRGHGLEIREGSRKG